jgi:tetratricopeptide (TPR) repeat protein
MSMPPRPAASELKATATSELAGADFAQGERVAGRYRIERVLGLGGMGVVYRAFDEQLDVDVALKVLRPELARRADAFERFRQEILLARQVSSPHVVRIHDLVQHEGRWLISMDFVDGESLEQRLDREGKVPVEQALVILRHLAMGLASAHTRGVVHRDLKPANVLLDGAGNAFISDFGVARSAGTTGITGSGVIVGTPDYLSPEQARADPVDGRSDLYALGLIFFEMLAGRLPFEPGTAAESLAQRLVRNPQSLAKARPDLPAWVSRLCDRLLQLRPARRLQKAEEVLRALDDRRVKGLMPRWPAVAALALIVAAGGAWLWQRQTGDEAATAPAAEPAPLALAVLPLAASDDDAALAAAAGWLLATDAASVGEPRVAGAERVARTLRQLGYDAEAAQRQAVRVAETLGARELLLGAVERDGNRWRVALRRIDPAKPDPPQWQHRAEADTLPAAVADAQAALRRALGAPPAVAWAAPGDVEALRAAGATLLALGADDTTATDAALDDAIELAPADPLPWRLAMEALDDRGAAAAAGDRADQATTALESVPASPARDATLAIAAVLLGDGERALELLSPAGGAAPSDPVLRRWLARAQAAAGRLGDARATLEAIVAEDPGDARSWYLLGRYAILQGDPQRGVDDYLLRAQLLFTRLGDARGRANTTNALGVGYERLGRPGDAAAQFREAATQRTAVGDATGAAVSLRNLSGVLAVQGDFDGAQQALVQARERLEPLGDKRALADVINNQGLLEEERGDWRKALDAYREALALRRADGDPRALGESLLNVGFSYYQLGEFDNALVYLQQADQEFTRGDDLTGRVRADQSLGLLSVARGEWPAARERLEETWRSGEEHQLVEETAVSLTYLAELDRLEGRIGSALQRAQRAGALFAEREDRRGVAETSLIEAAALADVGSWEAADAVLARLGDDAVERGEQMARRDLIRGAIALGRGDAAAARDAAQTAATAAAESGSAALALEARALGARAGGDATALPALLADAERTAQAPVRLAIAEARMALDADPRRADADARALLARVGRYGRAFALHAAAARRFDAAADATSAARARADGNAAADRVLKELPDAQRNGFEALRATLGLAEEAGGTPPAR